ncbi:hypothetical protein PCASD_16384 [Puccinia coronata f. sp. avenae]|uniref:DH domain-containing protein n=1 Tax=Puccinia coronata f. sp. avenae TaxID=200324 RepID=A0A2N5SUL1_9BASI|nr:hypothetical protein PCASD_16384 [Puccinia coronata f. sp. avenae]
MPHHQHQQRNSDSDCITDEEEEQEQERNIMNETERLHFLTAAGLLQRPITSTQQEPLPPLPSLAPKKSAPAITFQHSARHSHSHHRTHSTSPPIPPSSSASSSKLHTHELENDDPLSKMEAAFARYLNIQSDPPSATKSSGSRLPIQARHASRSLSGQRPSSEHLKSPPMSSHQNWIPRHRPSSSGSSLPSSSSHGFRSWLSGMSKTVSTATTSQSTSTNTWLQDKRQSSSSAGATATSAPFPNSSCNNPTRLSVSGPIHTLDEKLPQRPSTAQPRRPSNAGEISIITSPPGNAHFEPRTWSSIMDPNTLSRYSEKEKNRQEAIFELIETEATFVENCQILSQVFYKELEAAIGRRVAMMVFANIEDIMLFGTTFLSALERRQLKSRGAHVDTVGDVVLDYMQGVHVFRSYCSNQANATRVLADLKRRPSVANRLTGLKVKGLELEHYLLQPMQRLTRYPLLISQIMKYTQEGSPDFNRLANALKKVQQILTETNEAIREHEHELALVTLSEQLMIPGSDVKLSLATMTRFNGPRRLIRQGVLTKSRSRKTFRAYLFNDFFLLARPVAASGMQDSSQSRRDPGQMVMYRAPMALEECQVMPARDPQAFVVVHHSESLSLKAPEGPRAASAWLADFKAARKDVFKALNSRRSKRGSWTMDHEEERNQREEERKERNKSRSREEDCREEEAMEETDCKAADQEYNGSTNSGRVRRRHSVSALFLNRGKGNNTSGAGGTAKEGPTHGSHYRSNIMSPPSSSSSSSAGFGEHGHHHHHHRNIIPKMKSTTNDDVRNKDTLALSDLHKSSIRLLM